LYSSIRGKPLKRAEDNIRAADLPPHSGATVEKIGAIYERHIRAQMYHLW
jgi:hypothetical protein